MLEKENHQLLEYRGIGSWRKHLLLCPKGHQFEMSYNTLQKGYRCKFCSGKATHTEEDFIKILEEEKNQLLEYRGIGNKRKHLVLCPNGHKFETSYDNFRRGSRCPECYSYYSEMMCRSIFEKIFPNHLFTKCRPNFLAGLELDGYCSELNIAFEYNGLQHYKFIPFFHKTQERFEQQKERDKRKQQICKDLGIFLCVIPNTYSYLEPEKLEQYISDWIISPVLDDNGGVFL